VSGALDLLQQEAQRLHHAAPLEFNQFRVAFAAYKADLVETLLKTEAPERVECVRGHAQLCSTLIKMLEKIK
jgi:hypothetical protein